ncbi:hypothetical protein R1sor_018903 [Riccia sorocarpa]|uniref:Uncharacterized protein n=1 Tax=Riccia sorocarpa TaxID=122646 RepID=A0ABD3IBL2_9MARC
MMGFKLTTPSFNTLEISSALGDLISHRLEKSFGPLMAEANAGQALKAEVAELTQKLDVAERSRLGLNNQISALKGKILEQNGKPVDEAARSTRLQVQKELDHLKQESPIAKTTIGRLEAYRKAALQDANATISKVREELLVFQHQLHTHKASMEKYKAAFHTKLQKTASLDEQIVLLKSQIDSQKFVANRAEKAESTLRSELTQVKTELRMLQIVGN